MSGTGSKKRKRDSDLAPPPAKKPKLMAQVKPSLSPPHPAFDDKEIVSGTGLKWHEFSTMSFSKGSSSPKQQRDDYISQTGLKPLETRQQWPGTSQPGTMYRSRRGSIVGLSEMPGGEIKGWRLHSLPTSEALQKSEGRSEGGFLRDFGRSARRLTQPTLNSRDNKTPVNTVLSDFGKVEFDTGSSTFKMVETSHSMGISGQGRDHKHSSTPQSLYQPSIEVAKQDGKKGTAAQTYHSEPMSITLHNQHRSKPMEQDSNLIGMVGSFPNQVCFQCGRTYQEKSGKNSVVVGVPGVPFGGQQPGDMYDKKRKTTVSRATPMQTLLSSKKEKNQRELKSIFGYHGR